MLKNVIDSTRKRKFDLQDSFLLSNTTLSSTSNGKRLVKTNLQQTLDPKMYLLQKTFTDLPIEIIWYTNKFLSKIKFNSKIKFLETELIFWLHDLPGLDYNWLREETVIEEFIDFPHPFRNMKIPIIKKKYEYPEDLIIFGKSSDYTSDNSDTSDYNIYGEISSVSSDSEDYD